MNGFSDPQSYGTDGLRAALRATDRGMKNFGLTLLSSCAKHHIEKNETIWRVADEFHWGLDKFNLPPGSATRSREAGIIQQVAQQEESSCAERSKLAERRAAEKVTVAESNTKKWKLSNIKWKKIAGDRQLEICEYQQQVESLTAAIGTVPFLSGVISFADRNFLNKQLLLGCLSTPRFQSTTTPVARSRVPIDDLECSAGVFSLVLWTFLEGFFGFWKTRF